MASDTSRFSGGSADSYIGSLISLISKSEIRYEGVLFNVNTSESSIGLKNVRSFGTEGRRKDGPQVPPGDKVYEYILFRGTDIKDLQVISPPPVQTTGLIYNDPAIILSHYPQVVATSASLPSAVTGSLQHLSSQTSPVVPKSTFQGSLPLYQPSGSSESWGLSHPLPTTNSGRPNMPVYLQGFYGPSNGLQTQQHSLLQPSPGLSVPPSAHQTVQYPTMSAPIPNIPSNLPRSQLSESPPTLLPPFSSGTLNLYSSTLTPQSSVAVDSSTTSMSVMAPTQALSPSALSTSVPFAFPLTTVSEKSFFAAVVPDKLKTVSGSIMSHNSVSEPEPSFARASSSFVNKGSTSAPSLVTPNQLMQPGLTPASSSPSSQSAQEVEMVQISSPELPLPTLTEAQAPILPLPSPSYRKVGGYHPHTRHNNRGGWERVRGTRASRHITRFMEEFDFNAMNDKFNKDEVWGHFGKNNTTRDSGHDGSQDEGDAGTSKVEIKPVYVKDDFFDSLSCNAFENGPRNGRAKFSEQMKVDVETFGNYARHLGGRGGRGFGQGGRGGWGYGRGGFGYDRGGHSRGAYYGRSYNYNGRGWGHHTT